jgi:hypothetical protein
VTVPETEVPVVSVVLKRADGGGAATSGSGSLSGGVAYASAASTVSAPPADMSTIVAVSAFAPEKYWPLRFGSTPRAP